MEDTFSIEQIPAVLTLKLRQAELYPDSSLMEMQLEEDEQGVHFGLFHKNQLIAVVSCFLRGKEMQFRKFATTKGYQQKGFGTALLTYIIEFAKKEGIKKIWCNARTSATGFYKKSGMGETDEFFIKNGVDYVIMIKELNK